MLCNEHNNMNLTTGTTGIQDCRGRWILSLLFEQGLMSRLVLNYTLVTRGLKWPTKKNNIKILLTLFIIILYHF